MAENPQMSKWLCNICRQPYLTQEELKSHREELHGGKKYKCDLCHSTFFSHPNLKRHLKICLDKTIRKAEEESKAATLFAQAQIAVGAYLRSATLEPSVWDGNLWDKIKSGEIDTSDYEFLEDRLEFDEWFCVSGKKTEDWYGWKVSKPCYAPMLLDSVAHSTKMLPNVQGQVFYSKDGTNTPTGFLPKMVYDPRKDGLQSWMIDLWEPLNKVQIPILKEEERIGLENQLHLPPNTPIRGYLCAKDFATLNLQGHTTGWLNDEIINHFLKMVTDPKINGLLKCKAIAMSSLAFESLKKGYKPNMSTKNKWDIFGSDKILVPINESKAHWVLAVIDIKHKLISYYDSFGGNGINKLTLLLEFLRSELSDKKKEVLIDSEWKFDSKIKLDQKDPGRWKLQNNGMDCGMWVLMFAHYICNNRKFAFHEYDMPSLRERTAWAIFNNQLLFP